MILLDTHVLVWLDQHNPRLGSTCHAALDDALADDALVVSAISFWEVAMLIHKGRLALDVELNAIQAASFEHLHRDPADRLIAATATIHKGTLATADQRLLDWQTDPPRLSATQ